MSCEDLADVVAIEREAHPRAWSEENFLSEMRRPCAYAFVAHHKHRLLGYLIFWMICDEVHLLNLSIHPDFRGRGMGKKLMTFLIDFAHRSGAKWIGSEVRRSNRAALALYRSFGFREHGVRKGYYQDTHEDGILLEREFDREPM